MNQKAPWEAPPELPPTHYLDTRIHTDPAIFEEEKHSIFSGCWRLVCHSSELPNFGDYRTVEVAGKSILVLRGRDGQVRAFFNTCPHRGAQLVRKVRGNALSQLQCLYHLWSFDLDGKCTSITRPEGYENSGLDKNAVGLRSVRSAVVCGLVFVSLKDDIEPIEEFLGPMIGYLEKHLTEDLEVFHYHSAEISANWKLFVDNDAEQYHEFLHVLNRTTGMRHPSYHQRKWRLYRNGHSVIDQNEINYGGLGLDQRDRDLMPGMQPNGMVVMLLFPDVMINVRSTVMRIDTQIPLNPGRTRIEWRGLGLKSDTPETRSMRIRHHNQVWGPAGRNLQEDVIAVECQWKNMASGASRYNILAREEDLRPQDDENLRAFYQEWGRRVGRSPWNPVDETRGTGRNLKAESALNA
jgi:methanesulfonate monooxygenase large subunit